MINLDQIAYLYRSHWLSNCAVISARFERQDDLPVAESCKSGRHLEGRGFRYTVNTNFFTGSELVGLKPGRPHEIDLPLFSRSRPRRRRTHVPVFASYDIHQLLNRRISRLPLVRHTASLHQHDAIRNVECLRVVVHDHDNG